MELVLAPLRRETLRIGHGKTLILLLLLLIFILLGIVAGILFDRLSALSLKESETTCLVLLLIKISDPLAKNISTNFCKSAFPSLIRSDGSVANSPSEKANLFGLLFSSNCTLDNSGIPPSTPSLLGFPMPLP